MNKDDIQKHLKLIAKIILSLAAVYLVIKYVKPFGFDGDDARFWAKKWFYWPVRDLFRNTTNKPILFFALGITLVLERLFPADKKQKIFSLSFFQDMVWFVYETCLQAIILSTYIYALRQGYQAYCSGLTITAVGEWPYWGRFALGVLLTDFLFWLQHYINHKVPWFWEMHAVHHSQKEINFFTDFRYHIVEYMVRHTVLVIPFLILQMETPTIVWFSIFKSQFTHFYHGNIKTDLGLLRYILVTPQSHRVHHSIMPEHQDKNFGAVFSIWDFMFGTQVLDFDVYPQSGIKDKEFPLEKTKNPLILIFMPLVQMFYPFRHIAQSIAKRFNK